MFLTTGQEPLNDVFFGNTDWLNYAENDRTCDHIWLTMLLGNASQTKLIDVIDCEVL